MIREKALIINLFFDYQCFFINEVERIGLEPITLTLPVLRSSQMS